MQEAEVWPAILVAGVTFAIPQYLVSNFHGPWLVDVIAALISMGSLTCYSSTSRPRRRGKAPRSSNSSGPTCSR